MCPGSIVVGVGVSFALGPFALALPPVGRWRRSSPLVSVPVSVLVTHAARPNGGSGRVELGFGSGQHGTGRGRVGSGANLCLQCNAGQAATYLSEWRSVVLRFAVSSSLAYLYFGCSGRWPPRPPATTTDDSQLRAPLPPARVF